MPTDDQYSFELGRLSKQRLDCDGVVVGGSLSGAESLGLLVLLGGLDGSGIKRGLSTERRSNDNLGVWRENLVWVGELGLRLFGRRVSTTV